MEGLLLRAESVLHGEPELTQSPAVEKTLRQLLMLVALCGAFYGACMGSSNGISDGRGLQMVYSALKVPLLLQVTFMLSLPSFFVFNTLAGLRADFGQVIRALAASQAGLTLVLASLAPVALLWNASVVDHQLTILFNALLFGVATVGGQILLRRYYRPLIACNVRHRHLLLLWGILYTFVGIQMGWVLRPFVGDPDQPIRFFREDAWGNAYVMLTRLIQHVFRW